MESELLQLIVVFVVGLICGALIMLLWNKLSSGSASPAGLKQEYDEYQERVETHFEETSKKFQDMTEQYQDLYKHLSVGATSLCRPDSVAASLADGSQPQMKLEQNQQPVETADADVAEISLTEEGPAAGTNGDAVAPEQVDSLSEKADGLPKKADGSPETAAVTEK